MLAIHFFRQPIQWHERVWPGSTYRLRWRSKTFHLTPPRNNAVTVPSRSSSTWRCRRSRHGTLVRPSRQHGGCAWQPHQFVGEGGPMEPEESYKQFVELRSAMFVMICLTIVWDISAKWSPWIWWCSFLMIIFRFLSMGLWHGWWLLSHEISHLHPVLCQVVTMLEDLKAEVVAEGTTEEANYKKFLGGKWGHPKRGKSWRYNEVV